MSPPAGTKRISSQPQLLAVISSAQSSLLVIADETRYAHRARSVTTGILNYKKKRIGFEFIVSLTKYQNYK